MAETSRLYTTKAVVPRCSEQAIIQPSNPRLRFKPFEASDLHAFHEMRNQIEVMKWTSKLTVDATMDETRTWMNRFLDPEDAFPLEAQSLDKTKGPPITDLPAAVTNSIDEQGPTNYSFVVVYVEDDGSTRVVGTMGCLNVNVEPAIGYMFLKEEWGKGFATTTSKALLENWYQLERKVIPVPEDHVDRVMNILSLAGEPVPTAGGGSKNTLVPEILHAVTAGDNVASGRILGKCGFKVECEYTVVENGVDVVLKSWYRVQHVAPVRI